MSEKYGSLPTNIQGDHTASISPQAPVVPFLCGGTGRINIPENIVTVPALLACTRKAIDVSHILSHASNGSPPGFYWTDNVKHPTTLNAMVYDVFELYTDDDTLVSVIYTIRSEEGVRYITQAICKYSTQGISKFMSFLGQATDTQSYTIDSKCENYRRFCQYLQSIYTDPVFSGMGIQRNSCPFG